MPGRAARLVAFAAALAGLACGPLGPIPGGRLRGELGRQPIGDWSFTDALHTVQLETNPADPYSVSCWVVGLGDRLYVPTSLIAGTKDPAARQWVANVLADPRVRIRLDGVLYERRAVRVEDATEREAARAALLAKYEVEASDDGQEQNAWIFRLDPTEASAP